MAESPNQTVPHPGISPIISTHFDHMLQWIVIYPSGFLMVMINLHLHNTLTIDLLSNSSHVLIERIWPRWKANSLSLLKSSYTTPPMPMCISTSWFTSSLPVAYTPLVAADFLWQPYIWLASESPCLCGLFPSNSSRWGCRNPAVENQHWCRYSSCPPRSQSETSPIRYWHFVYTPWYFVS